jgi:hypothetical protein
MKATEVSNLRMALDSPINLAILMVGFSFPIA